MSYQWLAETYKETFRLQLGLGARDLQSILKEKHNYNATLSMCMRARTKALDTIIGDYKGQFGQIRDCVRGVQAKHRFNSEGEELESSTWAVHI